VNYAIAAGSGPDFRAVIGGCAPLEAATEVDLLPPVQQALGVVPGDSVICVRM
jgi:arginine/ornithine N-succinyltransferase beta subunit